MAFQNLCNFETFQQFWSHYGYEEKLEDTIEQEFSRIKGTMSKGIVLHKDILHFIKLSDYTRVSTNIYG